MPTAKINQFINCTRSIMVPLVFEDDQNQRQREDFKVIYKTFSPRVAREMQAIESGDSTSLAKSLAAIIVSIPEIVGPDNKPLEINEENLDLMDGENLKALYEEITKDVNPMRRHMPATDDSEVSAATLPAAAARA